MNYEEKCGGLREDLKQKCKKDVALAFSGGVDSSILLKLCCEYAEQYQSKVHAFTIQTVLHPFEEAEEARQLAEDCGAIWHLLKIDEWKEAGIEQNPVDRCYRCKKALFSVLCKEADKLQIPVVLEGTNLEDMSHYRPGFRAVQELGVKSPLHQFGFSKEEVRRLASDLGLKTAHKPSTPCLATRFPYNTFLSKEEMEKVDCFEKKMREAGYYNVRGRVHGSLLRIEVDQEYLEKALSEREKWIGLAKTLGYAFVTLDLQGFRSGSHDERLPKDSL